MFSYCCAGCGQLVRKACEQCASKIALCPTPHCSDALVALSYVGLVRDLMLAFKYRNHRALAQLFADRLVATLRTSVEINSIDVVTWVPTTRERRTARGHDQAETLARMMGRSLGVPVRKLLLGAMAEKVASPDAMANPKSIEFFQRMADELKAVATT